VEVNVGTLPRVESSGGQREVRTDRYKVIKMHWSSGAVLCERAVKVLELSRYDVIGAITRALTCRLGHHVVYA